MRSVFATGSTVARAVLCTALHPIGGTVQVFMTHPTKTIYKLILLDFLKVRPCRAGLVAIASLECVAFR